ncbi:histidine--tRNA ligase [Nitratifractor salsuginis]|uniref:Histidine--tRNA ligase n=1 Tax=Nitratifractor salsuginis (strain DSM 16511 / JCM 12458 / E9I37-1) TaxID=749222 RepID=E6X363_NITSE|nr:histidine--tRNA ligase [Nitratifractor salsuginis]ADV46207.1 histidyl-tRNA synthetase [Nitratifractor salsuginis DSM 16511]
MINALRGMKDLMFDDAERYTYIVETASRIARNYGFDFIETPILEETRLFKRSVGESSDIVGKEMYQFTDKGGNDVCLRPEGTAGVVRAYIQAKLDRQQGRKDRFFYYGPMFRYERPQKGRLRQFHQFGVESFGTAEVEEDFTLIMMLSEIFDALGIGYKVKINSLGCSACMPPYRNTLVGFLEGIAEELCPDCQRRITTNPIRVLDCKNENCQNLLESAPKLSESLCEKCDRDFKRLQKLLDTSGIDYEVDTHLVRGLDYYSGTAFEFVSDEIGAQSAIAGGGRYDRLVEFLEGKPTPGIGFAIGIERIMELVKMPEEERSGWYLGAMDAESLDAILSLGQKLRRKGEKAVVEYAPKGLKAHLKGADRAGAKYCAVIGENERKDGTVWVKDLASKEEKTVLLESL